MTEEYHRSMVFSIHRFIMRLLYVDFLIADVDVVLDVDEIAVADAEILAEAQGVSTVTLRLLRRISWMRDTGTWMSFASR